MKRNFFFVVLDEKKKNVLKVLYVLDKKKEWNKKVFF